MPLTLTVSRGFTFVEGTPWTTDDLNAAALPVVVLDGTLGSSDLAAGSINYTHITPGPIAYGSAAGSSNAYTVTLSPAPTAYTTGLWLVIKANHTNTGAVTVNVNGLGAKSVVKWTDQALAAGDIVSGQLVWLQYDGTNFQLTSEPGAPRPIYAVATGSANAYAITLAGYTFNANSDLTGLVISFKTNAANTGACTLNVNGKGAVSIKKLDGSDPASGDLNNGAIISVVYTGTVFQLVGNYGTSSLPNVGTAGTYNYPTQVVTDVNGRVTSVTAGSAPTGAVRAWATFAGDTTVSTKSGGAAVAATDQITVTGHGWSTGQLVWLSAGESYTGPTSAAPYYAKVIDTNTIQLCSDSACTNVVDVTADGGSGTFNYWSSSPITASGNVAAIIRVAQGQYDVTFTTALASANFAVAVDARSDVGAHTYDYLVSAPITKNKATTGFRIECYDRHDATLREAEMVDFIVVGA